MPVNWQAFLDMKHADGLSGKPMCFLMQACCGAWPLHFTSKLADALIHDAS